MAGPKEGDATAVTTTAKTSTTSQLPDIVTLGLLAQLSAHAKAVIASNGEVKGSPHLSQSDINIIRQLELHLARVTPSDADKTLSTGAVQPDMAQQGESPLATTTHGGAPDVATSQAGYPIPPAIWPPVSLLGAMAVALPQPACVTTVYPPSAYPYGPFVPYGFIL